MKETNVTHNIRVDKNQSNRKVLIDWSSRKYGIFTSNREYVPVQDFGMAMVNRKRGKRK